MNFGSQLLEISGHNIEFVGSSSKACQSGARLMPETKGGAFQAEMKRTVYLICSIALQSKYVNNRTKSINQH